MQMQQPALVRDYHQDAKAVLDRYCNGCHQEGGIAPFGLTNYELAKKYSADIKPQSVRKVLGEAG